MKKRSESVLLGAGIALAMLGSFALAEVGCAQYGTTTIASGTVNAPAQAGTAATPAAAPTTAAVLAVTAADLARAGFTGITPQPTVGTSFRPPNTYFHVAETVAKTHPEWGDAANLVAVLIFPMANTWTYNGGVAQTLDMQGRTQIRTSRPGYYIVVTGPDQAKVAALEQIMVSK